MSRLVISVTLLVLLGCSAAWSQTPSPPAAVTAANTAPTSPWVMASSLIAAAGLIVALTFQIINLRANYLLNSAKFVLDLSRHYDSREMRAKRLELAAALLADDQDIIVKKTSMVIEFFEDVGYMLGRGVLDEGMVHNAFVFYVTRYWAAITTPIDRVHKLRVDEGRPGLLSGFEELHQRLARPTSRDAAASRPSDDSIRRFLEREVAFGQGRSDGE
jgi:hypothetical protein